MNNKGQITVFLSCIICVLLLFTFTAFEVARIHTGKVKVVACVHSMRTGIMADYDSELFRRYHLLFLDTTYGTGNDAYLEEKVNDYLEVSLNGEEDKIYQYSIEDISLSDKVSILDEEKRLLKEQIMDYEKSAGAVDYLADLKEQVKGSSKAVETAYTKTEENATVSASANKTTDADINTNATQEDAPDDPRDTLSSMLNTGILNLVMPNNSLSNQSVAITAVSETEQKEKNTDFDDIYNFKNILKELKKDSEYSGLQEQAAFLNYIRTHFSNGVNPYTDTRLQCELEYMLKGKDNDYDNMEAVAKDLIWMRMPVNYIYLMSDSAKMGEADIVATAICTATGTLEFEKIIQYLLLGCWAYGESIYEVRALLSGGKIPYVKTEATWNTDLKNLATSSNCRTEEGLSYEDYLLLMFATKTGSQTEDCYNRMLDIMELNLQQNNPDFQIKNCVGELQLQGKITLSPLFVSDGMKDVYTYYFNERISYKEEEN